MGIMATLRYVYICIYNMYIYICPHSIPRMSADECRYYGVGTLRRLGQLSGLFCKSDLSKNDQKIIRHIVKLHI